MEIWNEKRKYWLFVFLVIGGVIFLNTHTNGEKNYNRIIAMLFPSIAEKWAYQEWQKNLVLFNQRVYQDTKERFQVGDDVPMNRYFLVEKLSTDYPLIKVDKKVQLNLNQPLTFDQQALEIRVGEIETGVTRLVSLKDQIKTTFIVMLKDFPNVNLESPSVLLSLRRIPYQTEQYVITRSNKKNLVKNILPVDEEIYSLENYREDIDLTQYQLRRRKDNSLVAIHFVSFKEKDKRLDGRFFFMACRPDRTLCSSSYVDFRRGIDVMYSTSYAIGTRKWRELRNDVMQNVTEFVKYNDFAAPTQTILPDPPFADINVISP